MAALRGDEGEGRCGFSGRLGSPSETGGCALERAALPEGLFSKLRAWTFVEAGATSLLGCTAVFSFFAPTGDSGDLGWGAREVMEKPTVENSSVYSTFNEPKQIQVMGGQWAVLHDFSENGLTVAIGDDGVPQSLDKVYGWIVPRR